MLCSKMVFPEPAHCPGIIWGQSHGLRRIDTPCITRHGCSKDVGGQLHAAFDPSLKQRACIRCLMIIYRYGRFQLWGVHSRAKRAGHLCPQVWLHSSPTATSSEANLYRLVKIFQQIMEA